MNYTRFRKKSSYDREKTKKRDNFNYLNNRCCKDNQIVLAGDSITEIFNMELFDDFSCKSGLSVYNRGISGDTSDRLYERFDENVLSINPRIIVLLIGTNDLSIKGDVSFILENIKNIITLTKEKCPNTRIIIQSIYPVKASKKGKNRKIIELNSEIKALKDIEYLNVYPLLLDNDGFNDKYTYDGLHPNAAGFDVVASEIIKAL